MSVVNYTIERDANEALVVTWPNMANGDTGQPLELRGLNYYSSSLSGTLGAGGTVTLEKSLAIASPVWLGGATMSSIGSGPGSSLLHPMIRPNVTSGDGTTNLTPRLYLMKAVLTVALS